MSDAQGVPSTALAVGRTPGLPPELAAKIEARRLRNLAVQQIRGTLWGRDLADATARAIAEYCHQSGIDPVRHVEILGGNLYLTATFYDELGAPLIQRGIIALEPTDFIHVDARLEALAGAGDAWATGERDRRTRERIRLAAPDEATAIAVTRMRVVASDTVIEGCNWCGGGTHKKRAKGGAVYDADPIGDLEPTKTAETRSRRRAWRKIARAFRGFGDHVEALEHAAGAVQIVETAPVVHAPRALAGGAPGRRDAEGRPVPPVTVVRTAPTDEEAAAGLASVGAGPAIAPDDADLHDADLPIELRETPETPEDRANTSAAADFICPFGHDGVKGKRLGAIDTPVLAKSLAWARANQPSRYKDFIEHAATVLADREAAVGQEEMEL
jgi:hypothetical protein